MRKLATLFNPSRFYFWSQEWVERNRPILVRLAAFAFLIFAILYLIPNVAIGGHRYPELFLLGVFAISGLVILILNPTLAMVAIVPACLIIPFGIGTGTGTELHAGILLVVMVLGLWVLKMLVVDKSFQLFRSRTNPPAFLLAIVAVVALGFGQLPWFNYSHASIPAQIGGTLLYILAAGTFVVVGQQITEKGLIWSVWIFILLSGSYVIFRSQIDRIYSVVSVVLNAFPNGATGSLFWVWLLNLTAAQLIFNKRLAAPVKIGLAVILVAFFYCAMVQAREWTSGWLPPIIGLGVMLFISFRKARVPVVLLILLALALNWAQVQEMTVGGDNEYSLLTRLDAWSILLKIIAVNPIIGVGPANYYFYTPLFPIRGYAVQFNSHNNYIDLLAQTGILGFGFFIWLLIETGLLALKLRSRVKEGFQTAFVYGALGGAVATAVSAFLGDWVIPFIYNVGYAGFRSSIIGWFFLGGLVALDRILPKETKGNQQPSPTDEKDVGLPGVLR